MHDKWTTYLIKLWVECLLLGLCLVLCFLPHIRFQTSIHRNIHGFKEFGFIFRTDLLLMVFFNVV